MFIEKPATKTSITLRKLVHGFGINDSNYNTSKVINGKRVSCIMYSTWGNVIKRCYSASFRIKYPTYKDCTVCDEWLLFSSFKSWMKRQDCKGKQIDKDILHQGNKHYSPSTCIFVTPQINSLLLGSKAIRGDLQIGVSFNKEKGKYQSECKKNGKKVHLGRFNTPELAFEAYKKFKYEVIKEVALKQSEPLRSALLAYRINPY